MTALTEAQAYIERLRDGAENGDCIHCPPVGWPQKGPRWDPECDVHAALNEPVPDLVAIEAEGFKAGFEAGRKERCHP